MQILTIRKKNKNNNCVLCNVFRFKKKMIIIMQKAQSSVWNDRWIAVTDVSRSDDPDPAHVNRLVP